MEQVDPPRPLTPWERRVIALLAPQAPVGRIDALRVFERCACGCASVSFRPSVREHFLVGEAVAVDQALKEHVEQARLRVEAALAVARAEFERRFAEDSDDAKKAVLTAIEESYFPLQKYEEQLLDCPACDTPAVVAGTLREEYDEDWDHKEGVLIGVHLLVSFIPDSLVCRACHLQLSGRDEMDAAGVGESWYLDDIDERDFLGDWTDFYP